MARRPNHITQPDGAVIRVLRPADYLTKAALRFGRKLTAEETQAALDARGRGVSPWTFADGLSAALAWSAVEG